MEKTEGTVQRVGGYRVVRRLATGGTSDVLLAKAEGPHGFERAVVLKLLLSQYKNDDEFKSMFAREASAYARLAHPSIVRLYDFFAHDEQLVMVLEYVDGPPLNHLRGMLKAVGQQFDDGAAFYVAGCIFDALAAAHAATGENGEAAPVIHRDVNPSNVLVPWDGHVKLADFGIAKVAGLSHQSSVGLIKGTYGYMAPEQVTGETVTPRADVYAGAIILWELLTKRRAFIRGALPEVEVLRELAEPRIPSIDMIRPDLEKSVRDALKRALEPRGEKRTMTAEEMVSILRSVVPQDEGRERLSKALALVRHEPKPALTSMPPPMPPSPADERETGRMVRAVVPARPAIAPRAGGPPRPALSRKTAPYGASLPGQPVPVDATPRSPGVGPPPRARTDKDMRAVKVPVADVGAVQPPERAALSEILRDVPSDVPPNVFPKSDPPRPVGHLPAAPAPMNAAPVEIGSTIVMTGKAMPSSFPAMSRTLAMFERPDLPDLRGSDVAEDEKQTQRPRFPLGTDAATAPPAPPPPFAPLGPASPPEDETAVAIPPPALALPPIAPPMLSPSTAKMRAFVVPKEAHGSAPPGALAATLPLDAAAPYADRAGAMAPRAFGHAMDPFSAHAPQSGDGGHTDVATVPPQAFIPEQDRPLRPAKRSPLIAVLVTVLVVGVLVLAGGIGYKELRKSRITAASGGPASPAATDAPRPATSGAHAAVTTAPSGHAPAAGPSVASAAPQPSAASPPSTPTPVATPTPIATPTPTPTPIATPTPVVTPTPPVATPPTPTPAAGVVADVPTGMGRVKTTGSVPGRRIFVDERTVGQTPDAVLVKCGPRAVKLGSAGSTQSIDVPCGGEIVVSDK